MTVTPRTGSRIEELLARSGRFFIPGEISADLRTVTRRGGRDGDVFYRDRWSHDKGRSRQPGPGRMWRWCARGRRRSSRWPRPS